MVGGNYGQTMLPQVAFPDAKTQANPFPMAYTEIDCSLDRGRRLACSADSQTQFYACSDADGTVKLTLGSSSDAPLATCRAITLTAQDPDGFQAMR